MPPGSSSSAKTSWAGRVKTQKEKQVKDPAKVPAGKRGLGSGAVTDTPRTMEESQQVASRERKEQWGSGP